MFGRVRTAKYLLLFKREQQRASKVVHGANLVRNRGQHNLVRGWLRRRVRVYSAGSGHPDGSAVLQDLQGLLLAQEEQKGAKEEADAKADGGSGRRRFGRRRIGDKTQEEKGESEEVPRS